MQLHAIFHFDGFHKRQGQTDAQDYSEIRGFGVLETIKLNPRLRFSQEEKNRVRQLLELDQSNVISFSDLEYEVASKVGMEVGGKSNNLLLTGDTRNV